VTAAFERDVEAAGDAGGLRRGERDRAGGSPSSYRDGPCAPGDDELRADVGALVAGAGRRLDAVGAETRRPSAATATEQARAITPKRVRS
jgi:hypothetical protein